MPRVDTSAVEWDDFSPRQKDVIRGVAEGLTYREIAKRMQLSTRTVQGHAQEAAKKIAGEAKPIRKLLLYGVSELDVDPSAG